jgi:hypothetical protein
MSAGIPTECVGCGARLGAHNITRLCAECKLVARNRRLSGQGADVANPVTCDAAIANITTILGGRILADRLPRQP